MAFNIIINFNHSFPELIDLHHKRFSEYFDNVFIIHPPPIESLSLKIFEAKFGPFDFCSDLSQLNGLFNETDHVLYVHDDVWINTTKIRELIERIECYDIVTTGIYPMIDNMFRWCWTERTLLRLFMGDDKLLGNGVHNGYGNLLDYVKKFNSVVNNNSNISVSNDEISNLDSRLIEFLDKYEILSKGFPFTFYFGNVDMFYLNGRIFDAVVRIASTLNRFGLFVEYAMPMAFQLFNTPNIATFDSLGFKVKWDWSHDRNITSLFDLENSDLFAFHPIKYSQIANIM